MEFKNIIDILSKEIPLTDIKIITVISAIVIIIIGYFISILVSRYIRKIMKKTNIGNLLTEFTGKVIKVLILIFSATTALGLFGIDLGAAVISISLVSGFIFGFAFQDTLGNLAAGFMIILTKPFKVGDYVNINGKKGTILDVGASITNMKTYDNKKIIIPNSEVWGSSITNYNAFDKRMIDLTMSISYDDDIKKAIKVCSNILNKHPKVLEEPKPTVNIKELADSSIDLNVRPWIKTSDYWSVKRELMIEIMERFDKENITIPYNQIDININNDF